MLVKKGGICREIDGKRLQAYKDKGYAVADAESKGIKPPKPPKGPGGGKEGAP